jgi:hypothetical protein
MDETLAVALGWIGCAIAICSYLGVRAWTDAQRREREAYYRNDAIKKVAEMKGETSEPVLALLREALKPPAESSPSPALMGPVQAKAFYKSEMLKKIAELKGSDADAVIAIMREEERNSARRTRAGLKLAGLILAGVGVGVYIFLQALIPDMPVYLVGLIPLLIGGAIFTYAFVFAPSE